MTKQAVSPGDIIISLPDSLILHFQTPLLMILQKASTTEAAVRLVAIYDSLILHFQTSDVV